MPPYLAVERAGPGLGGGGLARFFFQNISLKEPSAR